MINLIIKLQFHLKKRMILHLLMVVIISSMLPMLKSFDHHDLERDVYSSWVTQTSSLLLPFLIYYITIDQSSPFFRPFYAYFGKTLMFLSKWFSSLFIYTYALIVIFFIQETIITMWSGSQMTNAIFQSLIYAHADGILLLTLCLMWISDRYKSISLLIPVFWIVLTIITEDRENIIFYYLLPIGHDVSNLSILAYPYKLCYIVLVMIVSHQKSVLETI